ncbi:MAG: sigma factor-like helix-turn-helix DNA-binding protein [Candidatus Desantisbacteria bacterium]
MSEENVEVAPLAMDLVQLWRDGETERFDEIVVKYQKLLCSIAYLLLRRDYQQSCQIACEAFAYAYHNPYKFHDEHSLKIFLCQTLLTMAKERLKQNDAHKEELLQELLEGYKPDKAVMHWAAEDILAEKERLQEYILDNLETLLFDQMVVIILKDIFMLPFEEISEVMKLPLKTIPLRLHRARIGLRDKIKDVIYSGM